MKNIREFKDLTDFKTNNFFAINNCGFGSYGKQKEAVLRTMGRKDYHFVYVLKGSCTADVKEQMIKVSEGELLYYKPGEKQFYMYEKGIKTETFWIHFTGQAADEIMNFCNFAPITKIGAGNSMINLFNNILKHFESGKENLMSISYFIQFCVAAKKYSQNQYTLKDERIENVIKFMNENYDKNYTLDFYADLCHLSTTSFSHLFKKITGTSPHKYIINIRLNRIKYLISYTTMNINEIAFEVGFEDALYMSRLFKKYENITPSVYKQKYRLE